MNVPVDKKKYLGSIFFVFVLGAVLQLAISQLIDRRSSIAGFHDLLSFLWGLRTNLSVDLKGLMEIWQFVGSGAFLAGAYCWIFERWLWKCPFLQGRFVVLPNIQGTWVGLLVPETQAIRSSSQITDKSNWWEKENILPVHVTVVHEFESLIITAIHPNSENITLAAQLEHNDKNDRTSLYVVYRNIPGDPRRPNAKAHEGCMELMLAKNGGGKSAKTSWLLNGKYWTDKERPKVKSEEATSGNTNPLSRGDDLTDRGTWGRFIVHWASRKSNRPERFDWAENKYRVLY